MSGKVTTVIRVRCQSTCDTSEHPVYCDRFSEFVTVSFISFQPFPLQSNLQREEFIKLELGWLVTGVVQCLYGGELGAALGGD